MSLQMDVTPFLRLHEQDDLCTPPDFDVRERSNGKCRGGTATSLFPSLNVFFGDSSGCFYGHIVLSADVLKAWDPGHQGGCTKGHSIETLHHQHRARTLHLLRCKVGIYRLFLFVSSHLDLFSHKAVMDMEIQFLHDNFTEKDSKLLMEHIRRMASGEAPSFATTLSLVYYKLVEKVFPRPVPSGFGFGKSPEVESVANHFPPQPSTSVFSVPSTSIPSPPSTSAFGIPSSFAFTYASSAPSFVPQTPAPNPTPTPVPSSTATKLTWLRCHKCHQSARLAELYNGKRCPRCPKKSSKKWPPLMECTSCLTVQSSNMDKCLRKQCRAKFR